MMGFFSTAPGFTWLNLAVPGCTWPYQAVPDFAYVCHDLPCHRLQLNSQPFIVSAFRRWSPDGAALRFTRQAKYLHSPLRSLLKIFHTFCFYYTHLVFCWCKQIFCKIFNTSLICILYIVCATSSLNGLGNSKYVSLTQYKYNIYGSNAFLLIIKAKINMQIYIL